MVVVAIIGVLSTLAVVTLNRGPSPGDVARRTAGVMREASRLAVASGPLLQAVVANNGTDARVLLQISSTTRTIETQLANVNVAVPPANWQDVSTYYVPPGIELAGCAFTAAIDDGTTPDVACDLATPIVIEYYINGRCDGDLGTNGQQGFTLYLQNEDGTDRHRVVLLPLTGIATAFKSW
jgi:hypothetical protein